MIDKKTLYSYPYSVHILHYLVYTCFTMLITGSLIVLFIIHPHRGQYNLSLLVAFVQAKYCPQHEYTFLLFSYFAICHTSLNNALSDTALAILFINDYTNTISSSRCRNYSFFTYNSTGILFSCKYIKIYI